MYIIKREILTMAGLNRNLLDYFYPGGFVSDSGSIITDSEDANLEQFKQGP